MADVGRGRMTVEEIRERLEAEGDLTSIGAGDALKVTGDLPNSGADLMFVHRRDQHTHAADDNARTTEEMIRSIWREAWRHLCLRRAHLVDRRFSEGSPFVPLACGVHGQGDPPWTDAFVFENDTTTSLYGERGHPHLYTHEDRGSRHLLSETVLCIQCRQPYGPAAPPIRINNPPIGL
jgi:hypothetical protein